MSAKSLRAKLATATKEPLIPAGMDPPTPAIETRVIDGRYKFFNANSAPLEHLVMIGKMETREDEAALPIMRVSVARRLIAAFEGAYISGLQSPDLEPSVSGGGGGRPMSDFKIDCAATVDQVRSALCARDFRIIEGFCIRDEYLWRGLPRKQEQEKILLVHKALDRAGAALGMIRADIVKQRWSKPNPKANL